MKTNSEELELYIHIPFCVKKCAYCDFLSFPAEDSAKDKYVNALINEIRAKSHLGKGRIVTSVFIGGGTPSILSGKSITAIIDTVCEYYSLSEKAEISIECNPGTLDEIRISDYKRAGINRISIGLQSDNNELLKSLGRIHTYEDFLENYKLLEKYDFHNVNIDIMSGLINQTLKDWESTLINVSNLGPAHISAYSLILEEGTELFEKYGDGVKILDEETDRNMYHLTKDILGVKGYNRYEISNYALNGYECKHNIGYWIRKDYIGFGLGAASLFQNKRWNNTDNFQEYIKRYIDIDYLQPDNYHNECAESLSEEDIISEYMFLGLRMTEGISLTDFSREFGKELYDISEYKYHTDKMIKEKLLEIENGRLRLTELGLDLANYVMSGYII